MTMEIILNGEARTVEEQSNLRELLVSLGLPAERVAVELNGRIIPRSRWEVTAVDDGARLEVVHFVGGGRR